MTPILKIQFGNYRTQLWKYITVFHGDTYLWAWWHYDHQHTYKTWMGKFNEEHIKGVANV